MLIAPVIRTGKPNLLEAFFFIGPVTSFDDAVAPGTRFGDERVDAPVFFEGFCESRFALWMRGIFHRKGHRVISKRYEKGGRLSNAR